MSYSITFRDPAFESPLNVECNCLWIARATFDRLASAGFEILSNRP